MWEKENRKEMILSFASFRESKVRKYHCGTIFQGGKQVHTYIRILPIAFTSEHSPYFVLLHQFSLFKKQNWQSNIVFF